MLLGVRDDLREGALRSGSTSKGLTSRPRSRRPRSDGPSGAAEIAARAESDTADYEDLKRLLRAGSSLGGARPRRMSWMRGRIAIAKFPSASSDTWNVMAWEKVALDLARERGCGSRSQLITGRGPERAGRRPLRPPRKGRLGYASAMTMLEASDGDQRSYLEIAEVIEERSTAAQRSCVSYGDE